MVVLEGSREEREREFTLAAPRPSRRIGNFSSCQDLRLLLGTRTDSDPSHILSPDFKNWGHRIGPLLYS